MADRLCKGLTPGYTGGRYRKAAHAQRCGAIAEPGVDYCAAHAKQRGMLKCPKHGWVLTKTEHSWGTSNAPSSATIYCSTPGCYHIFETQQPWGPRLGVMGP